MNLLQFRIFIVFLMATIASAAQVPAPNEIWDGFVRAANADIYSYWAGQREKNRTAITDSITHRLTNLHKVLEEPYSSDSVNRALESVELLISNPFITAEQDKTAEQFYQNCINYEAVAKALYTGLILESSNKAFERVGKLIGLPEKDPVFVEWMSQDIKAALDETGIFTNTIDENYSYLNEKLSYVKENLTSLAENSEDDAEQLINRLRDVLNTVNEISPDFPKVKILLDQEFKTEE